MKNPVHIILKICIFVGLMFLLRKFNSIEPFGPHEFNDESMYYTVYDKAAASAPLKFPTKYFLNLNLFTEKVKDANLISKIKNEDRFEKLKKTEVRPNLKSVVSELIKNKQVNLEAISDPYDIYYYKNPDSQDEYIFNIDVTVKIKDEKANHYLKVYVKNNEVNRIEFDFNNNFFKKILPVNLHNEKETSEETIYEKQVKEFMEVASQLNNISKMPNTSTFIQFPYYSEHPLTEILKIYIISTIQTKLNQNDFVLGSGTKNNLAIIHSLYDIYTQDNNNDRTFVFSYELTNLTNSFTVSLQNCITIRDHKLLLNDLGEYLPNVQNRIVSSNFKFNKIEDKIIPEDKTRGIERKETSPEYYRIYNELYLMDPFITSGFSMQITKKMRDEFDKKIESIQPMEERGFCYDMENTGRTAKAKTKDECLSIGGIWDIPVTDSSSCPFYNNNKNYPNDFGGVQSGNICQMPMNMKLVGNRFYSNNPKSQPLCYNCKTNRIDKGSLGYCCDDQLNPTEYPTLDTPDYAFDGDSQLRVKYANVLRDRGLSSN